LHVEHLNQLGHGAPSRVNSTRLKERLLAVLPELRVHANGREILLVYEKDIGALINGACEPNPDSDTMVLAKAAKLVCTQIFKQQNKFSGTLNGEY